MTEDYTEGRRIRKGARGTEPTGMMQSPPNPCATVALLIALLGLTCAAGCVSTVTPPARAGEPVAVRVLSTGCHAGLLLACPDGSAIEYGYGAWSWYALAKDDWWRAPGTVLWPNTATLGRRYLHGASETELDAAYGEGGWAEIFVERDAAVRLLERLDDEFEGGGEPHYNELYDMWFVKHPGRFCMFHDCHDAVAEWLRELGCSVSRTPIRTGLRLDERDDDDAR